MSRLAQGFVFVAFLAVSAHSGQAQERAEGITDSTESSRDAAAPFAIPVEIIETPAEVIARNREAVEAEQREINDLVAQQGMHLATEAMNQATQRMASYALASTWLVGVGTVLLLITLWLSRSANKAAQDMAVESAKATRATEAAVAASELLGINQTRPWVCFQELVSENLINPTVNGQNYENGLLITNIWRNCGASPATNCSFFNTYRKFLSSENFLFPVSDSVGNGSIGPQCSGRGEPIPLVGDDFEGFLRGEVDILMFSAVTYNDASGRKDSRRSEVCYRLHRDGEDNPSDGQGAKPRIIASEFGPQNVLT